MNTYIIMKPLANQRWCCPSSVRRWYGRCLRGWGRGRVLPAQGAGADGNRKGSRVFQPSGGHVCVIQCNVKSAQKDLAIDRILDKDPGALCSSNALRSVCATVPLSVRTTVPRARIMALLVDTNENNFASAWLYNLLQCMPCCFQMTVQERFRAQPVHATVFPSTHAHTSLELQRSACRMQGIADVH